jgi:hypothetical protein
MNLPFRCILIGPSGAGKTNLLVDFLHRCPNTFEKLILCVKSADEPLYRSLIKNSDTDVVHVFEEGKAPRLGNYKSEQGNGLIIFDDLMSLSTKEHKPILEWFMMGRKVGESGFSVFYLTQNFYSVPKAIRNQASHLWIKRLSSMRDRNAILRECSLDVTNEQMDALYHECTDDGGFLNIDLNNGIFKHNYFDVVYTI